MSGAYDGVFHSVLTHAGDAFVGRTLRATRRYALVYRAIDHRTLREVCEQVKKPTLAAAYAPYDPPGGFGAEIKAFSSAAIELQERRHAADYNPIQRLKTSDAVEALRTARTAVAAFNRSQEDHRKMFLTLLVCQPRQAR